jgi:hypothetical protein
MNDFELRQVSTPGLGAAVSNTYALLAHPVQEGALALDQSAFTERALAETSVDDPMVGGYSAPAGSTPMPTGWRGRRVLAGGVGVRRTHRPHRLDSEYGVYLYGQWSR